MNNDTWIKRSERDATMADLPACFGCYGGLGQWHEMSYHSGLPDKTSYTHWRSIKCDPPPRGLTQRERDEAAAREAAEYSYNNPNEAGSYAVVSARYAIYAERREVLALLNQLWMHDWGANSVLTPVRQLRTRLDEQGGGK